MAIEFRINGRAVTCEAPAETPLLWVIREQLGLTGTKYGCVPHERCFASSSARGPSAATMRSSIGTGVGAVSSSST